LNVSLVTHTGNGFGPGVGADNEAQMFI
jgi:hypothetical protein